MAKFAAKLCMQSFGQKAAESSVPHESIVNLLNLSRTPHAFQNTRLRRQSPRNAVCKNETEKSAEFCVYRVGLHHCRTVPLQNSTSRIVGRRIVCEISAGFCISRPKLTIRKSPLPDSKNVIKRNILDYHVSENSNLREKIHTEKFRRIERPRQFSGP